MAALSSVKTAIADPDPQGTTSGWYQRRQGDDPALVDSGTAPFGAEIASLEKAGFGLLIIDTPAAQPDWCR